MLLHPGAVQTHPSRFEARFLRWGPGGGGLVGFPPYPTRFLDGWGVIRVMIAGELLEIVVENELAKRRDCCRSHATGSHPCPGEAVIYISFTPLDSYPRSFSTSFVIHCNYSYTFHLPQILPTSS